MGITSLTKRDDNLNLALGGLDKGISPLEMAGAYSTIANDGVYIEPTFYSRIDNKDGKTIIKSKQKKKRVFSKETAFILKDILKGPVEGTHGTATYCKVPGIDTAAKTGTTDNNFDRWLCGFTPYYTAVTWYGYDNNEEIYFNNRNPAGLLWANVMSRIHSKKDNASFVKPKGVIECTICSKTGKKARSGCRDTYTEYFLWLTTPGLCDLHTGEAIKNSNNNLFDDLTNKTKKQVEDSILDKDIDAVDPQQLMPKNDNVVTNNETINTKTTTDNNSNSNESKNNEIIEREQNSSNTEDNPNNNIDNNPPVNRDENTSTNNENTNSTNAENTSTD